MKRWLAVGALLLASCSSSNDGALGGVMRSDASAEGGGAGPAEDAGGRCGLYHSPTTTDLKAPTSLKTDVLPILERNCATTMACHAAGGSRAFLAGDSSTVRGALVNVASVQLSTMPYITPGDPSKSYLLHKMDGDQCYFDLSCLAEFCQESMPSSAPLLDVAMRDVVRRWIAQGANDN